MKVYGISNYGIELKEREVTKETPDYYYWKNAYWNREERFAKKSSYDSWYPSKIEAYQAMIDNNKNLITSYLSSISSYQNSIIRTEKLIQDVEKLISELK